MRPLTRSSSQPPPITCPPLVYQLKEGCRLVIPIGPPGVYQSLWKFVKQNGELKAYNLGGVSFVPLTGGEPSAQDDLPNSP